MRQRRRFPSKRQIRALKIGADELQQRLEWELRGRTVSLRHARQRYAAFSMDLLARMERAYRQAQKRGTCPLSR